MPTYGYRCGTCGHEFEIRQRITEEPLSTCPKCGGKLAKMLYPAGIIFKGSGYYTTDYKGSGNGSAGSSNGVAPASEGSSESKPETKSESTTESKAESKSEHKSESKSKSKPESKSGSTDKKGS
ncbi:MAG TPA: FmdB family zinc ribbon protein [Candidatus Dormibacteraeota bacterium]|jgi:putative FmdB family regulatory protein